MEGTLCLFWLDWKPKHLENPWGFHESGKPSSAHEYRLLTLSVMVIENGENMIFNSPKSGSCFSTGSDALNDEFYTRKRTLFDQRGGTAEQLVDRNERMVSRQKGRNVTDSWSWLQTTEIDKPKMATLFDFSRARESTWKILNEE